MIGPKSVFRIFLVLAVAFCTTPLLADDAERAGPQQAMFGNTWSRNMVSPEKGLPAEWDVKTGKNVLWSQPVGSQSYAGPVIHGGKVFVGTNNEGKRNPDIQGDKGVLMAFRADDGTFLWQIVHDKLPESKLHDWPLQGICSTPVIEGDRLYYTSNRAEIACLDTEGFRDGENDGPAADEKVRGDEAGDVVWLYDMMGELDVFPHNLAVSSPLVVGDLVFATTGNGVDENHVNVPSPLSPSFVAINKKTGELVWENSEPGEHILHGTWSNPTYGVVKGREQVIFPGGDGWLRSFEPKTGKLLWKFDCNPKGSVWRLGGAGTKNNLISTAVLYDDKVYIGVGQDPEHGEAPGHFYAIDATLSGDVTGKGQVWHRGGEDFNRTISTAAIKDDIVYIADLSGFLYALDAQTGEHFWTYDAFAAVWGSAFVADGKVYLGDEDGDVAVLKEGKGKDGEPEVLGEHNMGIAVYTTPVAHDGTLYVLARNKLFALKNGIAPKPKG